MSRRYFCKLVCVLWSVGYHNFLCTCLYFFLVTWLIIVVPDPSARVLTDVPKHKKSVMCFLREFVLGNLPSDRGCRQGCWQRAGLRK